MILSYELLKAHLHDLNNGDFTERDVWQILKRKRIYFRQQPMEADGYYEAKDGKEFIVLNSELRGSDWLRTALHELSHSFLDYPISNEVVKLFRSMKVLQTRQEITAEVLSLVMMFSFTTLEKYLLAGEVHEYLLPYVEERLMILDKYGI